MLLVRDIDRALNKGPAYYKHIIFSVLNFSQYWKRMFIFEEKKVEKEWPRIKFFDKLCLNRYLETKHKPLG